MQKSRSGKIKEVRYKNEQKVITNLENKGIAAHPCLIY